MTVQGNGENGNERQLERQDRRGAPDVLLDVPRLSIDEIGLEVDSLHARIALEARLGDLVELYVGADAQVGRVALEIKGVDAEAHLLARLDNVVAIIDRALRTVDQHPEILTELAHTARRATEQVSEEVGRVGERVGDTAGEIGRGAGQLAQQAGEGVGQEAGQLREAVGGGVGGQESAEGEGARRERPRMWSS